MGQGNHGCGDRLAGLLSLARLRVSFGCKQYSQERRGTDDLDAEGGGRGCRDERRHGIVLLGAGMDQKCGTGEQLCGQLDGGL